MLFRFYSLGIVAVTLVACGGGGGGTGGTDGQTGTLYVGNNSLGQTELFAVKQDGTRQRLTFDTDGEFPLSSKAGLLLFNKVQSPEMQFRIRVMNTDGTNDHLVPNIPSGTPDADLSSDGSKVLYANAGIFSINLDGTDNTPIRPAGGSPRWTPDGTKVVYTLWDLSASNIFVCNADGSNPTQITFRSASEQPGCFSVSNTHVAFAATDNGVAGIWIVPISGGQPTRLTQDQFSAVTVSFNAAGTSVYYTMSNQGVFKANLNNPLHSIPITQTWSDQTVVWGE